MNRPHDAIKVLGHAATLQPSSRLLRVSYRSPSASRVTANSTRGWRCPEITKMMAVLVTLQPTFTTVRRGGFRR